MLSTLTTVTQQPNVNPLDIPEILYRVGEFILLWSHDTPASTTVTTLASISPLKTPTRWGRVEPRWRSQLLFKPKTLLACIGVSNSWHKTLLPLLWHTFDQETMPIPSPLSSLSGFIDQYSHLFRILRWHDKFPDTLRCTQLVDLTLSLDDKQLGLQKHLVRTNPHLVSIEWFGMSSAYLDSEDFQGLQQLQHLKLYDWDVSHGRLTKALGSVSHVLKTLQLHKVKGLCPEDLIPRPSRRLPGGRHIDVDCSDNNIINNVKETINYNRLLTLPHLEHLCVNIEHDRPSLAIVRVLAMCCPNLEHLSIETTDAFKGIPLANTLRIHCPKLAFLAFNCGIQLEHNAAYLIRHCCSEPRLAGIDVSVNSSSGGLETAILYHASTLRHLKITWWGDQHINSEELVRLLVGCQYLETLSLNFAGEVYVSDRLLEVMSIIPWGGQLQELRLHLPAAPDKRNVPSHRMLMESDKGMLRRPAEGWELKPPSTFPDRQRYLGMNPVRLASLFRSVQQMGCLKEFLYNMVMFSRVDEFCP